MPDVTENIPLIVKSKEKQIVEKAKTKLNEKVIPINLKRTDVENRKKLKKQLKLKLPKVIK